MTIQSRPGRAHAAWRCHGHAGACADQAVQASPQATVTVRPLASLDHAVPIMPIMPVDTLVAGLGR